VRIRLLLGSQAKAMALLMFFVSAAPACRPQGTSSAPTSAGTPNYKPAPKRVNAEDIKRILNSKGPRLAICNAVAANCNPVPQLNALSPSGNIAPGSPGFTLVVSGKDFVPGVVVQWDYNPLTTAYVSSSQLTATVTPDLLAAPSVANIAVVNPTPGGGSSASLSLTIGQNPPPTVTFIFPFSMPVGTSDTTLFIIGSGLTDGSVVTWNGKNLPTTFFDNTFISAIVPASHLAEPGAAELSVFTPSPGGGTLAPELFPITVPLQTNDLAYDPQLGKLIASVPGGAGASGNSLRLIDPHTGAVSPAHFVGSEPGRLVLSDDGQFAYTGLAGSPAVSRVNWSSGVNDLTFFLGSAQSFGQDVGPNYARDLVVIPGRPHSVVVSRKSVEVDPSSTGLAVFDDGVQRPNTTSYFNPLVGPITFGGSPSLVFGFNDNDTGFNLSQFQIDASGVSLINSSSVSFQGLGTSLAYSEGRLYGSGGSVVDSNTGALLGSFPLPSGAVQFDSVAPDGVSGVTSLLSQDFSLNVYFTSYIQASFEPLVNLPLTGITFPSFVDGNQPAAGSLVRWGSDGLAFRDTGGQVYIIHSKLLVPNGNSQPIANALSPGGVAAGAAAFVLDVQGSNFLPGSIVTWNGSPRPTSFIGSNDLQAAITSSDVSAAQIATITVRTPAPGGGSSGPLTFTVGDNPRPQLLGVSPRTILANGPNFTLSVTGSGFVPGSGIVWNGSLVTTFYEDSGHLRAPMSTPTVKGPNAVTVVNPAPGGGESNRQIVNARNNNSIPSVASITPESAAVGTSGVAVTISGFNFTADSTAWWNGVGLSTSYVSPLQLAVTIPPALLANLGAGNIVVSNPAPGGGSSNETLFPVYLPLPFATDMVYEPFTRRLYLAMSDYNGAGPTLLTVDPSTGAQGTPVSLPGIPEVLALSDDGQFLYVAIGTEPLIVRFNVATQQIDSQFAPACSFAFSLAVMPGHPHTVAAACNGMTGIYDDGELRPLTFSAATGILAFASDSSLFMNSLGEPGSNIYRLAVDANGVTLDAIGNGAPPPFFSLGLTTGFGEVITPDGQLIDPNSLNIIGSLTGQNPDAIVSVEADESLGRIFGGSHGSFGFVNSSAYAFDPFRYQPLASLNVPGPSGSVTVLPRLLRWGQDGIAFQGEAGFSGQTRLYSVESPSFVLPQTVWPNPVPDADSVSPATVSVGSLNLRLHIKGFGFVRGAVVSLNGTVRETLYLSPTELIADVPAADLAKPGLFTIAVENPGPGGGNSAALKFAVK
jgi:hypothetical protein